MQRQWELAPWQASGRAKSILECQEGWDSRHSFPPGGGHGCRALEFSRVIPAGGSTGENSLTKVITTPTPPPQKVSINYLWLSSPVSCILMF